AAGARAAGDGDVRRRHRTRSLVGEVERERNHDHARYDRQHERHRPPLPTQQSPVHEPKSLAVTKNRRRDRGPDLAPCPSPSGAAPPAPPLRRRPSGAAPPAPPLRRCPSGAAPPSASPTPPHKWGGVAADRKSVV